MYGTKHEPGENSLRSGMSIAGMDLQGDCWQELSWRGLSQQE